jgi:hypothetical protein
MVLRRSITEFAVILRRNCMLPGFGMFWHAFLNQQISNINNL